MTFIEKLGIGILAYIFVASVVVMAIDFAKYVGRRSRYRAAARHYEVAAASEVEQTMIVIKPVVEVPRPLFGACPRLLEGKEPAARDFGAN